MDPNYPNAKFVAVKDGKIQAVGQDSNYQRYVGRDTTVVNLKDRVLIPGIIDSHSHFSLTTVYLNLGFDVAPPPFGSVTSLAQMFQNIKNFLQAHPNITKIYGYGYSDQAVVEHRHPTRYELDAISTTIPIVLRHYTGHLVAANSFALAGVNFTETAQPPAGGTFDRYDNGTLTGVVREFSIIPLLNKYSVTFAEMTNQQILDTINLYYSCGVTTAHDILTSMVEPTVYKALGDSFPFEINTYFWVAQTTLAAFNNVYANYSTSKVKVRGAKFILDGSIQAYTALLTKPYWVPYARQYDDLTNYVYDNTRSCATEVCGHNDFPYPGLLNSFFTDLYSRDIDVIAHTNGDATLDNYLNTIRYVKNNTNATSNTRFIAIHAQTAREDQLDAMKELGANPSFFSPHVYYWGDLHYTITLGPERANRISPAGSALRKNLTFTLHNDSPVVIAGIFNGRNTFMEIMDASVNRLTSSGRLLGRDQKIPPLEALKALTINAAWQSREQDIKGSITPGKQADLVLLTDNPLNSRGKKIKDIRASATVKAGTLVYGQY